MVPTSITATLPSKTKVSLFYREHKELLDYLAPGVKTAVRCCGAKIINYVQRWRDWKVPLYNNEWVYQTYAQIREDLMCEHSIHVIRGALALLIRLGLLERRKNNRSDNWRNGQDRTYQYRIRTDRIEAALKNLFDDPLPESLETNPFVKLEYPVVNYEDRTFRSEDGKFTVERHTQINSINCSLDCSTTQEVVEELVEEEDCQDQGLSENPVTFVPVITLLEGLQNLEETRGEQELLQDQEVIDENQLSAAVVEEEVLEEEVLKEDEPLEEEALEEEVLKEEEIDELARPIQNDVITECERLGIELNPKLEQLVLNSAVCVVKDALAFVREKQALGHVKNTAGYLVNAIKNKLQPSVTPGALRESQQKFPAGFLEWYEKATKNGWVDGREVRYLSTRHDGNPIVFIPHQGRSMVWTEALALFAEKELENEQAVDDELQGEDDYQPVQVPTVGEWVMYSGYQWKVEEVEGDLIKTLNLWCPALNKRVQGILPRSIQSS